MDIKKQNELVRRKFDHIFKHEHNRLDSDINWHYNFTKKKILNLKKFIMREWLDYSEIESLLLNMHKHPARYCNKDYLTYCRIQGFILENYDEYVKNNPSWFMALINKVCIAMTTKKRGMID